MATAEVKYTMGFADDTTQDITIGPFASNYNGFPYAKDKIIEFNANFNSDTAKLLTSKYGNEWTGVNRARIITTNITTYF